MGVFGRLVFIAIGLTVVGIGVDCLLIGLRSTGSESFGQFGAVSGGILIAIGSLVVKGTSLVVQGTLISLAWRLSSYYDPDD